MKKSLELNKLISLTNVDNFVDGAVVRKVGKLTYDYCKNYLDEIILSEEKIKSQDYGEKLAGNVSQEFRLEKEFISRSGFENFIIKNLIINIISRSQTRITKVLIKTNKS